MASARVVGFMPLSGKVEANSNLYSVIEASPLHELLDPACSFAGGLDREQYLLLEILSAAVHMKRGAPRRN